MVLIVCLDDDNGMMFNHRRQSQDRELRKHLMTLTSGKKLWMNHYSAKQFEEDYEQINVDDSFMLEAADGDYCFAEDIDAKQYEKWIEEIIVYRWNRKYPSDLQFSIPLNEQWKLKQTEEFVGSSHDKITVEVYGK